MAECKDFSEDLENIVTCVVCTDMLTEPKTLPCLHTFCFACIQSWKQTCRRKRKALECPSCRKPITVDVGNLPTSFHHNTMIQMYNDYKLKTNDKNMPSLNGAKLLIRNERDRLNEVLEKCKKKLELSDESRKRFDDQIDLAQKEACRNTLLQKKILEDHKETIITRLNDIQTTKKAENDEEKSQFNKINQKILNLTNQCHHLEEMNVEQYKSEDFQQLLDVCKTTVTEACILYKNPVERNSSVRYIPYQESIQILQDLQFGKVVQRVTDPSRCSIESIRQARCGFSNHFNIVTKDTEGDVCYTSKGSIDVQIQDIDGNDVNAELTESQTGRYIVKYKAQKTSSYKIVVSIAGIAISNSPQNIETIDAKAEIKPVRVFETTRAGEALALAVSDTGEIAVAHAKCGVVLFSADGEYLREFGGEGTGESRLSYPRGVAFNADRLLVINNQDDYGCIKEFDIHGNYNRTICEQKGIVFTSMCITEQSIAILCRETCSKKTLISFFSKQTGDLLHGIKLDIRGVRVPLFLAYDNNKYFVSIESSRRLYVFNENGGLLSKFGKKRKKKGQFNYPRGLSVFGADMIFVCDADNHRVQLLNQDGEFIRSFGSRGSGLGQMVQPIDVAVTPDGQVFVLELNGKRVQVFR